MGHPEISVQRCCQLFGRSNYYHGLAFGLRIGDLELMRRIDAFYIEHSWMGSCTYVDYMTTPEFPVGRDRVRRLMRVMGIELMTILIDKGVRPSGEMGS